MVDTEEGVTVTVLYPVLCVKPDHAAEISTAAGSRSSAPAGEIRSRTEYSLRTEFVFTPKKICRKDHFIASGHGSPAEQVNLSFGFFSKQAVLSGASVSFACGPVSSFSVRGYGEPALLQGPFEAGTQDTPHGPNHTAGSCSRCVSNA